MSQPTHISTILENIIKDLNKKIELVNKSIVKTETDINCKQSYLWATEPISIPWTNKYRIIN